MADAEPALVVRIIERFAYEFAEARPMLPTYLHLIASALFPIYTGAHASLSRPSTAAKPSKKQRKALQRKDSDTEDDSDSSDEEEDEQHIMEGLSPKDAILMPLFAGIALSGLYFLLKWMNDPTLLNKILNAYFAIFGVFSVSKLVSDVLDVAHSIIFPHRHVINGTLYHVNGKEWKAMPVTGDAKTKKVLSTPFPGFMASLPLTAGMKKIVWNDRALPSSKWSFKLYFHRALAAKFKIGSHGIVGALTGVVVVAYFNFVDKPWYLTNLLGFGFSYGALQLMSPTTFATGSLILGALFFYDIYFVFYTPMMVTVAKSLDVPIKLMFPRPGDPQDSSAAPSHAMLGLGDVVLPGIVIGLALRFDLYLFYLRRQKRVAATSAGGVETIEKAEYVPLAGRWSDHFWTHSLLGHPLWVGDESKPEAPFTFPKTYFKASLVGYVFGLLATLGVMMIWNHAQPALLYLVPGVLGSVWLTAVFRGELSLMWNYTEAVEEEEEGHKSDTRDKATTNRTDTEGYKRVTRSQGKAAKTSTGVSDGEDDVKQPRRSRRNRPEREIFSFTIEAPSKLEKSKSSKKHDRSGAIDVINTEPQNTMTGRSTTVDTSTERAATAFYALSALMTGYCYDTLANPNREIRIALLQPGEFADDIQVAFELCSLHDLHIEYEALSYVWGSEANPGQVCVSSSSLDLFEKSTMSITRNLEIALRYLRPVDISRRLWIDALCIDQQNDKERSTQVSIMGMIYASADRVIAWLGESKDKSDEALSLLKKIAEQVQIMNEYTLEMHPTGEDPAAWADRAVPIPWQSDQFHIVYAILNRLYFGRVWIQQELQLAKTVIFRCGVSALKEHDIWSSVLCLSSKPASAELLAPISGTDWAKAIVKVLNLGRNRLQPWRAGKVVTPLIAIRHRVRELSCKDPRDKIYAFLGLLGDRDRSLEIMSDYSHPVEEVYTDIVRRKATAHRILDLLWSCELSSRLLDVPTWYPDWSAPLEVFAPPIYAWSACGFISANVVFSGQQCIASGLHVSQISTTHSYSTNPLVGKAEAFMQFMQSIKPSQTKLTCPYKNGQGITEAYCRTLVNDRISDEDHPVKTLLSMERCRIFLEAIWTNNDEIGVAYRQVDQSQITEYMITVVSALGGSCFVTTSCGYIGIAPSATKAGDIITILFGCHKPIVLRPLRDRNDVGDNLRYLVVGSCYVHGIMNGEFIYQEPNPLRYKLFAQNAQNISPIDGYTGALFDRKERKFTVDPTVPLRNAGIEVKKYVRDPHELIVLPATLRAAGLAVDDFVLV
ncbi:Intramembrane protease 2 [Stagonosporopsis vannaccii]|nr:Intramembrane protease 2 [Stagonosporopsis vannaccii]